MSGYDESTGYGHYPLDSCEHTNRVSNRFTNSSETQESKWTAAQHPCRFGGDLQAYKTRRRAREVAEVHKLIAALGRHGALQSAESDADRRAIEAAITYMSDEDAGVGFLYSGWCQAAMPHKKLANEAVWKVATERVTLIVEPGRRNLEGNETEFCGVP